MSAKNIFQPAKLFKAFQKVNDRNSITVIKYFNAKSIKHSFKKILIRKKLKHPQKLAQIKSIISGHILFIIFIIRQYQKRLEKKKNILKEHCKADPEGL